MGTYCKSFVAIQAENLIDVLEYSKTIDKDWVEFCYNKWSRQSKWDPTDLLSELSKKFPEAIFYCKIITENCELYHGYFYDKEYVPFGFVYQHKIPSQAKLKKAIVNYKKYQDKQKQQQIAAATKEEEERKRKEILELKLRLKELQK